MKNNNPQGGETLEGVIVTEPNKGNTQNGSNFIKFTLKEDKGNRLTNCIAWTRKITSSPDDLQLGAKITIKGFWGNANLFQKEFVVNWWILSKEIDAKTHAKNVQENSKDRESLRRFRAEERREYEANGYVYCVRTKDEEGKLWYSYERKEDCEVYQTKNYYFLEFCFEVLGEHTVFELYKEWSDVNKKKEEEVKQKTPSKVLLGWPKESYEDFKRQIRNLARSTKERESLSKDLL